MQITGKSRVADLKPGDITQHAGGGGCDGTLSATCPEPAAPWRVEVIETDPYGAEVTWSHPPCGSPVPLRCAHDLLVEVWG